MEGEKKDPHQIATQYEIVQYIYVSEKPGKLREIKQKKTIE